MPHMEISIEINADTDKVYNLTKNMEDFPKYMSDVESIKILERIDNSTITEWVTNVEGTPITWKEKDTFDDKNKKIIYKLTEGDLDKFEGEWTFEPTKNGTLVTLGVDYDFGIPALMELIGPIAEIKVKQNSQMMLEGLKKKAESMR